MSATPPPAAGDNIRDGIEYFTVRWTDADGVEHSDDECQCARCGSSVGWARCPNCDDGEIDDTDNWEWPAVYRCDWCKGKGGHNFCLSTREFCEAHPLARSRGDTDDGIP